MPNCFVAILPAGQVGSRPRVAEALAEAQSEIQQLSKKLIRPNCQYNLVFITVGYIHNLHRIFNGYTFLGA
jgi:hypothetical protein